MSGKIPKPVERAERIMVELRRAGSLSGEQLCRILRVSPVTVRRDLQALEERGRLRRTHGGAILLEPLFYEAFRDDSSFQGQIGRHAEEKRNIGLAAAELVEDGDTIALTAGTTTTEVVRSIHNRRDVKVVTNTVNVAMELSKRPEIGVFVTGGHLRGDWFSLVGETAIQAMSSLFVDKVFVGVNGIDAEKGLTCFNPDEASINRVMIQQASRKIVVADHSKIGFTATHRICATKEVDLFITDSGAGDDVLDSFLAAGVEVRRV